MAWWKTAKPGDKIVCIAREKWRVAPGDEHKTAGLTTLPTYGEIYTVDSIGPGPCDEIYVKPVEVWGAFNVKKFRPVDPASKKADRALAALKDGIKTVREREGV